MITGASSGKFKISEEKFNLSDEDQTYTIVLFFP